METLRHKGTCEGTCPHARPGLEEQAVLLLGSGERLPHPVTAQRCPGAWREASQARSLSPPAPRQAGALLPAPPGLLGGQSGRRVPGTATPRLPGEEAVGTHPTMLLPPTAGSILCALEMVVPVLYELLN